MQLILFFERYLYPYQISFRCLRNATLPVPADIDGVKGDFFTTHHEQLKTQNTYCLFLLLFPSSIFFDNFHTFSLSITIKVKQSTTSRLIHWQFRSLKICRSTLLNYMKSADPMILRLLNCKRDGLERTPLFLGLNSNPRSFLCVTHMWLSWDDRLD